MKKKLFILCSCGVLLSNAQPGKEAWHWYFGKKANIDFNTGTAIGGLGIPAEYAVSQCASISDFNTGQYLFSFGGTKIFNKNNVVMSNGNNILADNYSTQALIIPKPDNASIFYVLTSSSAKFNNHGIHYSIVDMNLQGGLGEVTIKNKLLTPPPTTEKITAVKHCNGTDYWILTHLGNSNIFNAYLVTSGGIDTIPVVSQVGTIHQFLHWEGISYYEGIGCLKASPNGRKLALGIQSDSIPVLEIFDFDNSTGIVTNPITIKYSGRVGPYGISFSPDNSKLYSIPYGLHFDTAYVYQYDMSSGVSAAITASQTLITQIAYPLSTSQMSDMQMGPDGKIYIAIHAKDTLSIINNPNVLGTGCNFQYNGIVLTGAGVFVFWNVPNFIDANYAGININIPDVQLCNTFSSQTLDAGTGFLNYFWSTGARTQTISINSPGKYWITVTNTQGCTKTDTVNAYLLKPLREDTVYCGTSFTANVTQGGVLAYNWFDGNTSAIRNLTQSGNYYVDISYVNGCAIRDSIFLKIFPSASVNIGPDTTFCLSNLNLNAQNQKANYLWSTRETTQSITITKPETYWVTITDTNGCKASDTMIVRPQLNLFNFQMPNIVTPNNDNINDVIDFSIYQFSQLQIEIYNRWGQKVFESNDAKSIWKPTNEDGTYFYAAQYKIDCGSDSQTKNLKGYIQVLR